MGRPRWNPPAEPATSQGWQLAEVVTRMRRALRFGVRGNYPWERLPMAQVELLQRLADEPGLRVTDLARRHRLATNTVSNLVQQMVRAGLVERRSDGLDRRAVAVVLTAFGDEQLHGWLSANSRRLTAALDDLSVVDREAIVATLPAWGRLAQRLEEAAATEPSANAGDGSPV